MLTLAAHQCPLKQYTSSSGRHAGVPPGVGKELHHPEGGERPDKIEYSSFSMIMCEVLDWF